MTEVGFEMVEGNLPLCRLGSAFKIIRGGGAPARRLAK
jgi:hypothetical protein